MKKTICLVIFLTYLIVIIGCSPYPSEQNINNLKISSLIETASSSDIIPHTSPNPATLTLVPSEQKKSTLSIPSNKQEQVNLTYSPTADNRLSPEKWAEWPVIPVLSPKMKAIYHQGVLAGNNAKAFSKIGDCQNICEAFLCLYDKPGSYKLINRFSEIYPQPEYHHTGGDFSYLQETIDYFASSWGRESMAVEGGFNFPAIFSPLRANPDFCKPGETPLVCEIRLHKPSFVLIGMEYWYKGRTAENYENYLRKTVEYALKQGIIPIVESKADNLEGDHSINLKTAQIAYEYDIPFWNFWRAVQSMDEHGMDTRRDHADGFHISFDAQNVRSFTALQTLDSLRRSLEENNSPTLTEKDGLISTPSLLETQPPQKTITSTPVQSVCILTPEAEKGSRLLLSIMRSRIDGDEPIGNYMVSWLPNGEVQWQSILENEYRLWDISPDGCQVLVSNEHNLYVMPLDSKTPILISRTFFNGDNSAFWNRKRNQIIFIDSQNDVSGRSSELTENPTVIIVASPDGKTIQRLMDDNIDELYPIKLYSSQDSTHIYWEAGICDLSLKCVEKGPRLTTINTSYSEQGISGSVEKLVNILRPTGNSLGNMMAYVAQNQQGKNRLYVKKFNDDMPLELDIRATHDLLILRPPTHFITYRWDFTGERLSVIGTDRSDYSGNPLEYRYFITSPEEKKTQLLPLEMGDGLSSLSWSPTGKYLAFSGTEQTSDGYKLIIKIFDVERNAIIPLELKSELTASKDVFIYPGVLLWLP